ncbi:Mitochondrial fusion and transport protein Ugo1 [Taphrina deformans PYCC 5710]|uniref:Mitochondrial fusion and transport protein Ugo1 n=1 Tax=Taphrina deformans (strain PYCC 5710 / ATCC 11124 / CBS 356.35 / IMI 108563 / JCM 9778 / NBRC 8474) TaxID=1097556 RepID=R4XC58_TAPDE|nr:Mitochondrial fusion and transport protein Ugo1 [Taphrina deformans PYCC 5710]|eukprot:CCG83140.1 Mitochondrial fusion and transport protein Ugo1 [Taphrina deformans PYCC 5710]
MDPIGPSVHRPYYTPKPTSYLSGRIEPLDGQNSSDLPYDFIDNPSLPSREAVSAFAQAQIIEYIGICIAQPFENAKILLQCQLIPKGLPRHAADAEVEDDEEADPDYFSEETSHAPTERRTTDRLGYIPQNEGDEPTRPPWQIAPKYPPTLGKVMDAVWTTEGLLGSLKSTNLSFMYHILQEILEGQFSGILSALFSIPDPILALESSDTSSLAVTVVSAGLAAILLAPLDIARTKIILTPISEPRGIIYTLRSLPSRLCPPSLVLPTLLERIVPAVLQHALQSLFEPISGLIQLFLRLPLETVLRRAQVSYSPPRKSIVHLGAYNGIFGTPLWITSQEGDGAFGLYRGWKAGLYGVVGVWSLGLVTGAQENARTGTEF